MNRFKIIGAGLVAAGGLTKAEWAFIISIALTVLGMIQDYIQNKKTP